MAAIQPVLFIGIDGGEPALIRRWIDDGSLPELARLCRDGISGAVETLPGFGDGATWPTLVTGVNPARHGRYFRRQLYPRSYRPMLFDIDRHLRYPPFWNQLSDAGRKVAILDIPYTPTTKHLNGLCLVDWFIHDRYGPPRGFPASFAAEVLERFGDDPIEGDSDKIGKDSDSQKWLLDRLLDRIRQKSGLVTEVLARGGHDFVATCFTEPHDIGHVAWHMHDTGHCKHDPEWRARHGDPLKTVYTAIDAAIGRLVANVDESTTVMVFSGLGMGPNYTANNVMHWILARLEGRGHADPSHFAKKLRSSRAPALLVRGSRIADRYLDMFRMSRSRFFAIPHNENSGAIRINLKGREPFGRVDPRDLDAVCEELAEAFGEMIDPVTGIPVVSRVVRVAKVIQGDQVGTMPDLFVVWNRESPFDSIESPRIGRIDGVHSWGRTGDHTSNAMLVVRQAGNSQGELRSTPGLVDIPATIGALLDVPLRNIEGRPIPEFV